MPKILVIRYPTFAGGHFVANVLALHNRILHMDLQHATNKFAGKHNQLRSFGVSMMPAVKSIANNSHFEYNTFNGVRGYKQELWNTLMDQDKYVPVVDEMHTLQEGEVGHQLDGNKNKIHLRAVNTKWLMQQRNKQEQVMETIPGVDTIDIDMGTLLDSKKFFAQINKVIEHLQFEQLNFDHVELMLHTWLKSIKVVAELGYQNKEAFAKLSRKIDHHK